ncbi:MAG: carbohydrate binding family 9 domain-containing protein [Acidobacteria bacterium]|nr:carbohydrate binding family 9 domain-containing protein [Acidobacteriota bacterium]
MRVVVCLLAGLVLAGTVEAARLPAIPNSDTQVHAAVAGIEATRITAAPRIDGHLDDEAWASARPATEFVQRDPDEGQPATQRTELRVVYDGSALYIGARLFDTEPDKIVRRLERRDSGDDADWFTVYLDPHHDHLTGAQFRVNAAGTLADAIIYNDTWTDESWDAVWDAAVSVDAEGWTAEMRIPFSQLRFPRSEHDTWGINAARFIQRRNETSWIQLVPKRENGLASRMAHLTGVAGIDPPHNLEVLPYSVARAEFVAPSSTGDPFNDGSRLFGGMGLDLKYGLTSNFTLNAAINPDFGQVEVDPAIVNLSAFETFFEERRPFFIEGAQIFRNFGRGGSNSFWGFNNAEPQIFYSRRIGRSPQGSASAPFVDRPTASTILGAAKLTGKSAKGWNVGLLEAVTGREYARLSGADRSRAEVEPLTNYFIGRLQREVARGGFGLLTTLVDRNLGDGSLGDLLLHRAHVVGADGYVFLDKKHDWVITGMMSGSRVSGTLAAISRAQQASQRYFQRPDARRLDLNATSMSGWAGRLNLNRNSGVWQVNAALWGVSPGFESGDLGFTFRAGVAGTHAVLLWRKPEPDRFTRSRGVFVAKWWTWDSNRIRQGDGLHFGGNATFLNYWESVMHVGLFRRAQDSWLTRGGPIATEPGGGFVATFFGTDSRKRVSLNFGPFYSWNEFGGGGVNTFSNVTLKPSSSVSVSFGPSLNRSHSLAQYVTAVADPRATETFGTRYVFSDLDQTQLSMSVRATWSMTPRMSVQVYAQPLLAVGDYRGFKELARPGTFDFLRYGSDIGALSYDAAARRYSVEPFDFAQGGPDLAGPGTPFTLADPDFNFKSLRANVVFRWEWRLGSTLYIVWTEQREDSANPGTFSLGRDTRALFGARPADVFLVKLAYWISR